MKSVITNNGLNLLSKTRADGTVQYWIGYFGLAYVPDELRDEDEAISAGMDSLTIKGDNIYNIFQGSMVPTGNDTDRADSIGTRSPANKLYNECMYTSDIMSRYRYVLDKDDNNQLIVFKGVAPEGQPAGITEYFDPEDRPFKGISSSSSESSLPIPAPLYYLGEPKSYDEVPSGWNPPVVSCDTRDYSSSTDVDSPDISDDTWANADNYDWTESKEKVYTDGTDLVSYTTLDKFWQHQSVSNYNRFHAPANYEGYAVGYDPATRNICKATKLFPIGHYDVKSTASEEKVSTVQYTVDINLNSVFDSVAAKSTNYYDKNGEKLDGNLYPVGFKFNRVGIYAVSVTLHSYNTDDPNGDCAEHNIQMQVNGEHDPVLFAVIDLDSPVVMKQGGLMDFSFKLDLKIGSLDTDSDVVNNTSIYYNLYEDDAITWYKNQLIANASTADAITTLGVQMNYLRKQMASMSTDSSSCGLGDDGDRYALAGHTHNFMKNIVDVDFESNGAVRGIFTKPEGTDFNSEATNGLEGTYNSGTDSMTLGKGSATVGDYSINMSRNGVIGDRIIPLLPDRTNSVLLVGDSGADDKYITLGKSYNSIFNIDGEANIPTSIGSMMLTSKLESVSDPVFGDIYWSSLVGASHLKTDSNYRRAKITEYLRNGFEDLYTSDDVPVRSVVSSSSITGPCGVFSSVSASNLVSDLPIGTYDALEDMDSKVSEDEEGYYDNVFPVIKSVSDDTDSIYNSLVGVNGSFKNTYVRLGARRVFGASENSIVPVGSNNVVMMGTYQNTRNDCQFDDGQLKVYTLDEFKTIFENGTWNDNAQHTIVLGNGSYEMTRDSKTYLFEAHGVCCYVSFSEPTDTHQGGFIYHTPNMHVRTYSPPDSDYTVLVPVNDNGYITNEMNNTNYVGTFVGPSRNNVYLDLYERPGHLKNLMMLGDYQSVGYGSENSVFIGDYSAWPKIRFKNSIINLLGDRYPYDHSKSLAPKMEFDNVMWFGHIGDFDYPGCDSFSNGPTTDLISKDNESLWWEGGKTPVFKNAFVFTGDTTKAYGHAYWYGLDDEVKNVAQALVKCDDTIDPYGFVRPMHSPMIYTGGMALAGYGTNECNFMLLKIGMSSNNFQNQFESNINMGSNQYRYQAPYNMTFTVGSDTSYGRSRKFIPSDPSYSEIYERNLSDGVHYTMDSPYAGMVLMVQKEQELDGTLHVGLGRISTGGSGFSTDHMTNMIVSASYVSSILRITVDRSTSTGRVLENLDIKSPYLTDDRTSYTEGQHQVVTKTTSDGKFTVETKFVFHEESNDEVEYIQFRLIPNDEPCSAYFRYPYDFSWSGVTLDHENINNKLYVQGMDNAAGQMVYINISNDWFYYTNNGTKYFQIETPRMETRSYYPSDHTWSSCAVGNIMRLEKPQGASGSTGHSILMVPMSIPGYYRRSEYADTIRVDSTNESTYNWFDGKLPYMVLNSELSRGTSF